MKKTFKIIGTLFLLLIIFRGLIYRTLVKYNEIGTRQEIVIHDKKLINKIDSKSLNKKINIEEIVEIANEITTEALSFTTNNASHNPNQLIHSNKANCIGYSALFNSIVNYIIKKNKLQHKIIAKHKIGQLELLGINIHNYIESPFFRDHDFNEVTDMNSGNKILIDPSLSDYLWIHRARTKE
jgi:hypothetical protein